MPKHKTASRSGASASAKETWACIDVVLALGYAESVDAEIREGLRSVQRVLARLVA